MNGFTINLSTEQIALILGLLKPYAELSASLTYQYQAQSKNHVQPVKAEKVETTETKDKEE